MTKRYVWLDLETTGTDEHLDPILEVGVVVTDKKLTTLCSADHVVEPAGDWQTGLSDFVREMHTGNGLILEVVESGEQVFEVESQLISLLSDFGEPGDFILAGSGVAHFDRRFLAAQLPDFLTWFKYYSIDVGVMRRVLELCGRDDLLLEKRDKNHRALDDARYHLEEMRHIKQALESVEAS